jgi:hypothetical protein
MDQPMFRIVSIINNPFLLPSMTAYAGGSLFIVQEFFGQKGHSIEELCAPLFRSQRASAPSSFFMDDG